MKRKKLFKWVFIRIPIAFMILIAIMAIALKLVERYPEPLQDGMEEYLSEATNSNASIGVMEKFGFMPNIDIRLKDLTLHDRSNTAITKIRADYVAFSSPIWSLFTSRDRVNEFTVDNLEAVKGSLTPHKLTVRTAGIVDENGPEKFGSFLRAEGTYGGQDLFFEAEVEKKSTSYRIPKEIPFSLSMGQAKLNATLDKGFLEVVLKNTVYTHGSKNSVATDYILDQSDEGGQDNPLYCMVNYVDGDECLAYLSPKELKEE